MDNIDECLSIPCHNGGSCIVRGSPCICVVVSGEGESLCVVYIVFVGRGKSLCVVYKWGRDRSLQESCAYLAN